MNIELTGDPIEVQRKITGFYSLDRAFINEQKDLGVPINVGYELFGSNHVGKSSFAYSFAGLIAPPLGIVLCDFEGFDPKYILSNLKTVCFSGRVHRVFDPNDETQLDKLVDLLRDGKNKTSSEFGVGIVDSLGAISPVAETEGEIGERNMGQRAFSVAQFTRKIIKLQREAVSPKTILAVNHWYPKIGSRGYDTPAGDVKKYLLSIRVLLRRKEEFKDGSYVLEGYTYKNRWGYKERRFYVFMLAGKGIHRGMSALYDGTLLGVVERKKIIKIGEENFGYMKNIIMEHAHTGDDEFFQPFIDILKTDVGEIQSDDTDIERTED